MVEVWTVSINSDRESLAADLVRSSSTDVRVARMEETRARARYILALHVRLSSLHEINLVIARDCDVCGPQIR